jgi:hypothetical protein
LILLNKETGSAPANKARAHQDSFRRLSFVLVRT